MCSYSLTFDRDKVMKKEPERPMLRREELTEPELAVWNAVETGTLVQLPIGAPAADDPATGETWGQDRQVRAQLLYELLAGVNGPEDARPRALKLAGARITGTLDLEATSLVCPLTLRRCSLEHPVNLQEAQAPAVRLPGCRVPSLNAEQFQTRGNFELNHGFTAKGQVNLMRAHIGGVLSFDGATLTNDDGPALNAEGLTVDEHMFCRNGFTAQGEIRLPAAHIGGQLVFDGATLTNGDGSALAMAWLRARTLALMPQARPDGQVDLSNARVDDLYDAQATWPKPLLLSGLEYNALHAEPEVTAEKRLRWLERDPGGYAPQLYEQLAAFYRRAGQDDDARKVAIAKQRRRRQTLNGPGKAWSSLLRWTVGYGYQTWKAGLWLLVLIGLGWWIFDRAHPAHLAAAKPPGQRPWFHAGLYALDLLLPFVDLGYQGSWIAGGWVRGFYLGWNLAGWILITAVVAALSGLIKRD
jgi:hypothetical protein